MPGVERSPRPPVVPQGTAPHCWAAATTSWLTLHRDRPQLNRQQLIDRYGDPKKGGSIGFNTPSFQRYMDDLQIYPSEIRQLKSRQRITDEENAIIDAQNKADKGNRPPVSLTRVAQLFNAQANLFHRSNNSLVAGKGYVLLIFAHTHSALFGTISHMVVVFGTQIILGEPNLVVMDPNQAGSIRPLPLDELKDLSVVHLMIKGTRTPEHKPVSTLLRTDDI